MAIRLRAARPSAAVPREQFVADLHRRLDAELRAAGPAVGADTTSGAVGDPAPAAAEDPEPGRGARRAGWPSSRRRLVGAVSAAVAGAAAGVGVGRALLAPDDGGNRGDRTEGTTALAAASLRPAQGMWRTVAASADLPEGAVRPFDLQTVTGFVMRRQGSLKALCGVCTHQGCRLQLNSAAGRLDCPCHNAAFSLTGTLLPGFGGYRSLPPLPRLAIRENNGEVQVFAPAEVPSGAGRSSGPTAPPPDDDGSYSGSTSPSR